MRHPPAASALVLAVVLGSAARAMEPAPAAPGAAPPSVAASPAAGPWRVPYRLTDTNHLLVRARLNGKGPYHFIVDTGAPALYVMSKVAEEAGLAPDGEWAVVGKLEFEGGATLENVRARAEDPYQLTGMNAMGLPGVRLDGVLGYNVLARFRLDIDLTRRVLLWTPLDAVPPDPPGAKELFGSGDAAAVPGGALMEGLVKIMAALSGGPRKTVPRGCLGMEVEEKAGALMLKAVYEGGPAAAAGLRKGDILLAFRGRAAARLPELYKAANAVGPGDAVRVRVRSYGEEKELTLKAGEGF